MAQVVTDVLPGASSPVGGAVPVPPSPRPAEADVWAAIARDIETLPAPDPGIDRRIAAATWPGMSTVRRRRGGPFVLCDGVPSRYQAKPVPEFTRSVDVMRALFVDVLPGWWVSSGICGLTGHASCGPDYNGRHGPRLRREFPLDGYDPGFHADLAPGPSSWREAMAVAHVYAQAREAWALTLASVPADTQAGEKAGTESSSSSIGSV